MNKDKMNKIIIEFRNSERYEIDKSVLIDLLKKKDALKWVDNVENIHSFMRVCFVNIKWDEIKDKAKNIETRKIKDYELEWRNCKYE